MNWKIKSLIFLLVLLSVPIAAIALNSESTIHKGDASIISKSTGQATVHNGDVSMTSRSTNEVTVNQGDIYTISLNEGSSSYKWTLTHSNGLKLLSDTLDSNGKREIKFLTTQKGRQTIEADYSKYGEENIKHTSEFVLNVV